MGRQWKEEMVTLTENFEQRLQVRVMLVLYWHWSWYSGTFISALILILWYFYIGSDPDIWYFCISSDPDTDPILMLIFIMSIQILPQNKFNLMTNWRKSPSLFINLVTLSVWGDKIQRNCVKRVGTELSQNVTPFAQMLVSYQYYETQCCFRAQAKGTKSWKGK